MPGAEAEKCLPSEGQPQSEGLPLTYRCGPTMRGLDRKGVASLWVAWAGKEGNEYVGGGRWGGSGEAGGPVKEKVMCDPC